MKKQIIYSLLALTTVCLGACNNNDEIDTANSIFSTEPLERNAFDYWLLDNYKKPGDVNIVELQGTVGSAPAIDRKKGFEEVIKKDPRFKITRSQTGDFTRAKGKEVMEAFLKTDKNIQVLYAHNDDMAIGAIQAIEAAGLKPGQDIIIVSIDAVKGAFEAMMAGKLNVTVECNPQLGPQLMTVVKEVLEGKEQPKWVKTKESVFPMETAAKEFPNRKY